VKKIFILMMLILMFTGCSGKNPDDVITEIDRVDQSKEQPEFEGITQKEVVSNDETTDDDNDEILTDTFFLDYALTDREFKSGIINDDTLEIITVTNGNPQEEFELFFNESPTTTLSLLEAFDIYTLNLKVVDKEANPIFEITFSDGNKSYMVAPEYSKKIKEPRKNDYSYEYLEHEIITDLDGNPGLLVYFKFSNYTNEPKEFLDLYAPSAFQDGIELETYVMFENPPKEFENRGKSIKDGANLDVCFSFPLLNETSDVELIVTDQNTMETMTEVLSLN